MDQRTLAEMRQMAAHLSDLAHRLLDGADEMHRRLSAIEDQQAEYQAGVRRLRTERDAS